MKKSVGLILSLALAAVTALTALTPVYAQSPVTITIATVNNGDMVVMQGFTDKFQAAYPNIKLKWVVLPENELRTRVTTDVASGTGSFDVVTVGAYEVPTWAKNGWIVSVDGLMTANPKNVQPNYDKADLLKSVSDGISYKGELYAVPFYAESSMTFYNKAMFKAAGLTMPDEPTWDQIREFACKLNQPDKKQYGIALRGLPGWGEALAVETTVVNTFGGKWFDANWNPQLNSKEWHDAMTFYVNLLHDCGVPGAANNGYTESITAMAQGQAAIWVDASVSAGALSDPKQSKISNDIGFAMAPYETVKKGYHWLWSWNLAIPKTSANQSAALQFITWATSKDYIQLVGTTNGWGTVPPGTRTSTYALPEYQKAAAAFAALTLKSIQTADPTDATKDKVPYVGVQFVGIPEFEGFGTDVSQQLSAAVAGKITVDDALAKSQDIVTKAMTDAGYIGAGAATPAATP
ncbi:MAG TPA: sugar ABC transporter substrate-binding protein [Aggregatilineales bacterium]|nr:sugar ABC transporter substrate-binding protein [Aggregatilineales bacterium]